MRHDIENFNIISGRVISGKYRVIGLLGKGWEGEVYLVEELQTGIERAAKFFYPSRNPRNRTANSFAKKLFRNRHHQVLVQYIHQERISIGKQSITCLISEFIEGEILSDYIDKQKNKRLDPYLALMILWEITNGLAPLHLNKEYHGDLHTGNVLLWRQGIHFRVKLIDSFDWKDSRSLNVKKDVVDLARILYDMCGGAKYYSKCGKEIKQVCCGLKASLINRKFKHAGQLRDHLDTFSWEQT